MKAMPQRWARLPRTARLPPWPRVRTCSRPRASKRYRDRRPGLRQKISAQPARSVVDRCRAAQVVRTGKLDQAVAQVVPLQQDEDYEDDDDTSRRQRSQQRIEDMLIRPFRAASAPPLPTRGQPTTHPWLAQCSPKRHFGTSPGSHHKIRVKLAGPAPSMLSGNSGSGPADAVTIYST